jgi:drug/metabolite transporter (DMT)-like permease
MSNDTAPSAAAHAPRYPLSGWIEAGCYVIAIAILTVTYVVGHQLGAHPIAFVLYAMLASAVVLIAYTGFGTDAREIMLAPQTWLVGAGTIGMEIFYYLLLAHVAPAHASLVVRLAIPAAMLTGFLLFKRRPPNLAIIGVLIVLAGIVPLIVTVPGDHRLPVIASGLASAVAFNMRGFAAEFHPYNRNARTVGEKLRVTGLIVLVSSIASIFAAGAGALAIGLGLIPPSPLVPSLADMVHVPTILLGTLVGSVILTAMAYLGFSSVVKITTENFTATSAFTPVATLLVQVAASATGLIPSYALDWSLLPAMAVVIAGVFLILAAARRRS